MALLPADRRPAPARASAARAADGRRSPPAVPGRPGRAGGGQHTAAHSPFRLTAARAALAYLGLALLFLAPAIGFDVQLGGTDWTPGGYPVLEFVGRVIASGRVPTWIPGIMGGLPIFANPGATFHPLRLALSALLPDQHVLAGVFAVHFALAGVGAYLLLRELGTRRWVAFVGGLAFEFTGALASLLYAGHDGRFMVAASAPLVLWAVHRGARTGAVAPFALLATLLGLALLGFQLQSVYYLLLVAAAWAVYSLVAHNVHRRPVALARRVAFGLGAVALAGAVAAVNLLPFAGYVSASPRGAGAGRGYEFATSYSMPPQETLGFAVPEQVGMLDAYAGPNPLKYHTEYAGALVVLLAVLGIVVARRDRRWQFFATTAAVGLTVAWGGFTPLYRVYYALLPGTARFRAPGIALYVVSLAAVLAAALTLERLAAMREEGAARMARTLGRSLAAVCALAFAFGLVQQLEQPGVEAGVGWLRFATFLALVGGAVVLWLRRTLGTRSVVAALAVLTIADLWLVDRRFLIVMDVPERLYAPDDVATFLRTRTDLGRVWVFPRPGPDGRGYLGNGQFGVQTNYLLHAGIPQAGGEHGNQLQRWNEYVGAGTGREFIDWHNLMESGPMLSAAAVRYIVSRADLTEIRGRDGRARASGLVPVYTGTATVYRNGRALPRAYLVPAAEVARGADALAAMRRADWDPSRTAIVDEPLAAVPTGREADALRSNVAMVADAADSAVIWTASDRPALLVVADNYYPGWTATVDGQPATVHRANHTFRAVEVSAGAHEVRFRFRPAALFRGLWISIASLALLLAYAVCLTVRHWWTRRRQAPGGGLGAAAAAS